MNTNELQHYTRFAQELCVLRDEILEGRFGLPGELFPTTRKLSELRGVSVVTAHNLLSALCKDGFLELRGKKYILTHGEMKRQQENDAKRIGLVISSASNEFFASLTDAVIRAARQKGYLVMTVTTDYSPKEERRALDLFAAMPVAGIIVCAPVARENEAVYRNLDLPCVFLSQALDGSGRSSVQVNSFSASQKVAQHLVECGYRRFLYVGTRNISPENDVRYTGFSMELSRRGFSLPAENVILLSGTATAERSSLPRILRQLREPVGIFCYHDLIAAQVYRLCHTLGKSIPDDVGVVGFDDLSFSTLLTPPLTTVRYRITSMADMAVKLLTETGHTTHADNFYVEPMLVIRESTHPAASES